MGPVRLHRIGADPEFLFGYMNPSKQLCTTSAQSIINKNKEKTLKSFIGTDNHSFTAEFRPSPSHDINRIILELAHGITYTYSFLQSIDRYSNMKLLTIPCLNEETLGGHIHMSFLTEDPVLAKMQKQYKLTLGPGNFVVFMEEEPTDPVSAAAAAALSKTVNNSLARDAVLNTTRYMRALDYLFVPLDFWVQEWDSHALRLVKHGPNGPYGIPDDIKQNLRLGYSKPSNIPSALDEWAYFHYEYRLPTTWLAHPWLAYLYLGIAKLVMTNFEWFYKQPTTTTLFENTRVPASNNARAGALFAERFELALANTKLTADIAELPRILPDIKERIREWWHDWTVDERAWRALIQ